jgi:hypothetical protein
VLVRATVSSQGFDHRIDGKLRETVELEKSTGMVLAQIPVLRLVALGSTEDEAKTRLRTTFEDFCTVELERGKVWRLLDSLVDCGFFVFNPKTHPHQVPLDDATDFLTIHVSPSVAGERNETPQKEYGVSEAPQKESRVRELAPV